MKRRDFFKAGAVAGVSGAVGQGCSSMGRRKPHTGPGFDVHPFVKNHPEAVFIQLTDVKDKLDSEAKLAVGKDLSRELIVKTESGGYPFTTPVNLKPNWTSASPRDGKPVVEKLGVTTDTEFVEGWAQGMKEIVDSKYFIRECCCPRQWEAMGWIAMTERNNIDFRDLSTMDVWRLKEGRDLVWEDVPDGVFFKKIAQMAPMNVPGTFLVNMAKMKAHGKGITATIKNLQGICARRFHQFCTAYLDIRKQYPEAYMRYFHEDFERRIETLHARHVEQGIPRWDKPAPGGGLHQEVWIARALDNLSVTPTDLHLVEGIYSQDGNGFGRGPHEPINGITSRDYLSNMNIFGVDPFRVDIITHWLCGHEPGNFGLFHIGMERGMSDVLYPGDIPVYLWDKGEATLTPLDRFKRTPLVTYYLQRDYDGQAEPEYHLVDEPFDYTHFRLPRQALTPSISHLGKDNFSRAILELAVPENCNVRVDVIDSRGNVVSRTGSELAAGIHQVLVNELRTGIYDLQVNGLGWKITEKITA